MKEARRNGAEHVRTYFEVFFNSSRPGRKPNETGSLEGANRGDLVRLTAGRVLLCNSEK